MSGLHDEGMLARANKIKAMFGVQLKEQATLPGISREKTGESAQETRYLLYRDCRFSVGTFGISTNGYRMYNNSQNYSNTCRNLS